MRKLLAAVFILLTCAVVPARAFKFDIHVAITYEAVGAVLANLPVGHGGTFSQPMGGAVASVAVDWLEWQLKGDKVAARTFQGANCRLCAGTEWTIERKGF